MRAPLRLPPGQPPGKAPGRAGQDLSGAPCGPGLAARPVKTFHGAMARGSVATGSAWPRRRPLAPGLHRRPGAAEEPDGFAGLDLLVCQSHFPARAQGEPGQPPESQNALPLLAAWRAGAGVLVHLSCRTSSPDEAGHRHAHEVRPRRPPLGPQRRALSRAPVLAARQAVGGAVFVDHGLSIPVTVAHDRPAGAPAVSRPSRAAGWAWPPCWPCCGAALARARPPWVKVLRINDGDPSPCAWRASWSWCASSGWMRRR